MDNKVVPMSADATWKESKDEYTSGRSSPASKSSPSSVPSSDVLFAPIEPVAPAAESPHQRASAMVDEEAEEQRRKDAEASSRGDVACGRCCAKVAHAYLGCASLTRKLTGRPPLVAKKRVSLDPDEDQRPECALDPESQKMAYWDMFIMTLLVFTATVTPFEVGFLGDPEANLLFFLNRIVDCGFITDMFFQFHIGFYEELTNTMVWNKNKIAHKYLRSWFAIDLISVIPFDSISFISATLGAEAEAKAFGQLKFMRVIRLMRLMKLLRLIRSARILQRQQAKLGWSYVSYSLMKFSVSIIILMHWLACFWAMGTQMLVPTDMLGTPQVDWVFNALDGEMGGHSPGPWDKYIACVEFSLMAMVFGYGAIEPVGTSQRAFALVCMFIGGSVYVYMIGAICEAVSSIDPASTAFKQTMDMLNMYLSDIRCAPAMREQFRSYFLKAKEMMRHSYYQEVLEQLSPGLRGAIAIHCHSDWLSRVPFFNCPDETERERFVVAVALKLKRRAFTRMEPICTKGEPAMGMYIIMTGLVGCGGSIKRNGSFFGTDMIMGGGVSNDNANAVTFVDTQLLERACLLELLQGNFPKTLTLVRKAAFKMTLAFFVRSVGRHARKASGLKKLSKEQIQLWKDDIEKKRQERVVDEEDKHELRAANYDPDGVDHHDLSGRLPGDLAFSKVQRDCLSQKDNSLEAQLDELRTNILERCDARFASLESKMDAILKKLN